MESQAGSSEGQRVGGGWWRWIGLILVAVAEVALMFIAFAYSLVVGLFVLGSTLVVLLWLATSVGRGHREDG
jgi:hypothetical protein